MSEHPMVRALNAWLTTAAKSPDPVAAAEAAAKAIEGNPWQVVEFAGMLARTQIRYAENDLGLTTDLYIREVHHRHAIVSVPKGAPFPSWDTRGKRKRGAFDTPQAMALQTVRSALAAAEIDVQTGLDPA